MDSSRRTFLKLGCHAAVGGLLITTTRGWFTNDGTGTAEAASDDSYGNYNPRAHAWAFVVDTTKCIGCGRCARACKSENNVPYESSCNRTWIERYRFTDDDEVYVDSPAGGINGFAAASIAEVTDRGTTPGHPTGAGDRPKDSNDAMGEQEEIVKAFFVPKLCNQCERPPCVQVCPVGATYKTEDGVVLVNQKKCIGCRYCIQACPYGARYLVPDGDRSPTGQVRVADKCTWCYHRITKGLKPACVEACPVGARQFGDLNEPDNPITPILRSQRIAVLKPDLGTRPRVKYVGLDEAVV